MNSYNFNFEAWLEKHWHLDPQTTAEIALKVENGRRILRSGALMYTDLGWMGKELVSWLLREVYMFEHRVKVFENTYSGNIEKMIVINWDKWEGPDGMGKKLENAEFSYEQAGMYHSSMEERLNLVRFQHLTVDGRNVDYRIKPKPESTAKGMVPKRRREGSKERTDDYQF